MKLMALVVAAGLVLVGCGGDDGDDDAGALIDELVEAAPAEDPMVEEPADVTDEPAATTDDPIVEEPVESTEDEFADLPFDQEAFCDPADVEDGDSGFVTAMHFVRGGVLDDEPCHLDDGLDGDPVLVEIWDVMTEVVPTSLLDDVSLFAGYEGCPSCETLAFVDILDVDGTFFLMAVDTQAVVDDPDEAYLTLLHELAHVFTQLPGIELDVAVAAEDCATYHNGNGCLYDDSYLVQWIDQFWSPDDLAAADPNDDEGAAERCSLDPAFPGSYAATDPEEDFAESFSAFVFDVEVDPAAQPRLDWFADDPTLAEVRDRARATLDEPIAATLERCG